MQLPLVGVTFTPSGLAESLHLTPLMARCDTCTPWTMITAIFTPSATGTTWKRTFFFREDPLTTIYSAVYYSLSDSILTFHILLPPIHKLPNVNLKFLGFDRHFWATAQKLKSLAELSKNFSVKTKMPKYIFFVEELDPGYLKIFEMAKSIIPDDTSTEVLFSRTLHKLLKLGNENERYRSVVWIVIFQFFLDTKYDWKQIPNFWKTVTQKILEAERAMDDFTPAVRERIDVVASKLMAYAWKDMVGGCTVKALS
jgi:hypothetical protein